MPYGLRTRLLVEHGLAAPGAGSPEACSADRPWRALAPDCRLALIERAMTPPANDLIDAYPLAL